MYENLEQTKDNYLYLKDYIEKLNVSEFIKNELTNFNLKIYNWKKHKTDFNFNILIDNLPEDKIKILLSQIVEILRKYEIVDEICEYSRYEENYSLAIKENGLLIIDDFEYFEDDILDNSYRARKFFDKLNHNNCLLIITCEKNIQKIKKYSALKKLFDIDFNIRVTGENYTEQEIIDKLKKYYQEEKIICDVTNNELENIINNLLIDDKYSSVTLAKYLYDYSLKKKILNCYEEVNINCFPTVSLGKEKTTVNLDEYVGFDNIKNELKALENFIKFRSKLKCDVEKVYLNMFFMGNPGTGKTTVARKCAEIFYNLGIIQKNKVVEIIPTDLMANYVGQTKDKTREILEDAHDGVLFIDEAYLIMESLNGRGTFMNEAVVELLKYLEDPNNIVIFAGYPDLMKKLYEVNPGLKSRIYKEIYFEDYSEEELLEITKRKLKKYGLSLDKKAITKVKKVFRNEINKNDFGNARFCEQYVQNIIINHANRVIDNEDYKLNTEDVDYISSNSNMKMGFVRSEN